MTDLPESTVDPEIRKIAFHHPGRLSAWDHFIKVGNTRDGVPVSYTHLTLPTNREV